MPLPGHSRWATVVPGLPSEQPVAENRGIKGQVRRSREALGAGAARLLGVLRKAPSCVKAAGKPIGDNGRQKCNAETIPRKMFMMVTVRVMGP